MLEYTIDTFIHYHPALNLMQQTNSIYFAPPTMVNLKCENSSQYPNVL